MSFLVEIFVCLFLIVIFDITIVLFPERMFTFANVLLSANAVLNELIFKVFSFVNYKKGCTGLTAASDKVYRLLSQGRSFSLGTPASSITKTGRHDIADILLKVALNSKIQKFI